MIPAEFAYYTPASLDEALALLGQHGDVSLAGGDVLPVEMPVEADGGVDFIHDRVGAFAEASAPHFVAHDGLLLMIGWLLLRGCSRHARR